MINLKDTNVDEDVQDAFRLFDRDRNWFIDPIELRNLMKYRGEKLSPADLMEMIREADVDGDDQLSYQEFVKMMTSE